jgi:addiction module RelB/DinJ family antitoxin
MQTAVVNIKIDPEVKKEAQKIAQELGFSLSAVLTGFIKTFIREKSINFSLEPKYSDYFNKSMKQSEEDIKNGWVSPTFDNIEDEIAWLNDPKAKYVNQLRKKV